MTDISTARSYLGGHIDNDHDSPGPLHGGCQVSERWHKGVSMIAPQAGSDQRVASLISSRSDPATAAVTAAPGFP